MKRDKPIVPHNKPTKESLYNFVINEKLSVRNSTKMKKEEDSSEGKATNAEEVSNTSVEPLLNSPKLPKKFDLTINLDADSEEHYEYLLLERNMKEEWELETNKEDLMIWTKLVRIIFLALV